MIRGYIEKILWCSIDSSNDNNIDDMDDDNNNLSDNVEDIIIYNIGVIIICDNDEKTKVIGKCLMKPEKYDELILNEYNVEEEINKYTNRKNKVCKSKYKTLISIQLPTSKFTIENKLGDILQNINKELIQELYETYRENIWNLNSNIKKEKKLTKRNKEQLEEYINNRINNEIQLSKYILDFLVSEYSITLDQKEFKKIQKVIDYTKLSYPFSEEQLEILLLNLVGYIDLKKIGILYQKMKLSEDTETKLTILYNLRKNLNYGSSCIDKNKIMKECINCNENILNVLVQLGYIKIYEDSIYEPIQYNYEMNIAEKLSNHYKKLIVKEGNDITDITKACKLQGKQPNEKQKEAILTSLNNPITIINGGPGYGKTSVLEMLFYVTQYSVKSGLHATIIGPTGKVISKIEKDLMKFKECFNVYTLHRLTYYFNQNRDNDKYDNDKDDNDEILKGLQNSTYIIIDEISMVSNEHFSKLLDIIDKYDITAKLIFIGDTDQISSISPGSILNQMLKSTCIPFVKLEENLRARKHTHLVNAIEEIKKGTIPNKSKNFEIIDANDRNIKEKINSTISHLIKDQQQNFKDIAIITPTRENITNYTESIRKIAFDIDEEMNDIAN